MLINANFTCRASLTVDQYQWVASPQAGVERIMLDRIGGEQAQATSIVRYAPGAHFPSHPHPGGEEILVLSGTFSEGDADYPAGWYLRNPPGSSHQPHSAGGALIFVRLGQMAQREQSRVRINTADPSCWQRSGGKETCPLFADEAEQVRLVRLAARETPLDAIDESVEILVLAGAMREAGLSYGAGSWVRLPAGVRPDMTAAPGGATIYLKSGHPADMAGRT